ncbi:MAG TPA: FAD-dependent oxidoreductase [Candidatus Thiothrix moscowensis]|uniref:NAD(P)/FAD-dependent oxidoreductase n=1 Tax=unclassified Thiothrix TaxID=2636184 RepID=UPI0025D48154|nr:MULTISPECIES: FAD-dependent oxidoreductase [unclassified Thiothrix]HRJ51586.1 FAD-dependent oxidoreductase [Candidatus Thiothrix moscowensis]HRJ91901.1 FAD-dependent oxidoreductase [Candidatus Thiothrix moscowensis]
MNPTTRRQFLKSLGLATLATGFPAIVTAATTRPHVIVIGGGFAGATAAKYLRHWSTAVDVTLIEANANYNSCILSNLVLNNQMNMSQITFNYNVLAQKYGIRVINDWVNGVDGNNQTVSLRGGTTLAYDRLIIAPGVQFLPVTGLDSNVIPHAWKAGVQTTLLQQQLAAMPNNGKFVMTIPAKPYRCPPGPYERACVVADYLKRNKPGATVTVLDANADIVAERETFNHAFTVTYAGIVNYVPNAVLTAVDSARKIAHTSLGDYTADVLNVIPPQSAGEIIHSTGLANVGGHWAGVNPLSYESTAVANIHVIGDSQGTGQPKAGHIANAEAKVCADAILRLLGGNPPFAAPVTNSACYSPISATTASWLTAAFAYDTVSRTMKIVPESSGEASAPSRQNYQRMFDWANNLFADTFA